LSRNIFARKENNSQKRYEVMAVKRENGAEDLRTLAIMTAGGVTPARRVSGRQAAGEALAAARGIREAAERAVRQKDRFTAPSVSEEWLLDNLYEAEACASRTTAALRRARKLTADESGVPAALLAARALAEAGEGLVTEAGLREFLEAYQSVLALSEADMAAFLPCCAAQTLVFLRDTARRLEDAAAAAHLENAFRTLRFLRSFEAAEAIRDLNVTERLLRGDPSGEYPLMSDGTRALYRRELSRLAFKRGLTEKETAERVLALSRESGAHVGRYIFTEPLGEKKKEKTGAGFIALSLLPPLCLSLLLGFVTGSAAVFLLTLLPLSELIRQVIDALVMRLYPPRCVPRMALKDGVPGNAVTVCVRAVLLASPGAAAEAVASLEGCFLRNRDAGENALYAVLADLAPASAEATPEDEAVLAAAKAACDRLNEKYGGGFFALCRDRVFSEADGEWRAWERKRGATLELARYLCAETSAVKCLAGDGETLRRARYILILDGDTGLTAGAVRKLVGAAVHPLNRPVVDGKRGVVTGGHAVIRPRLETALFSACRSPFALISAGAGGTDPYGSPVGDVYQDLFDLGSFCGKGIVEARAYISCLGDAFPDDTVLSHDLLEGAYLRACYDSETVLTDGYPYKAASYFARLERWTRGDWQTLPWVFRRVRRKGGEKSVNPLSLLDRWKVFDNIRRALVPPMEALSLTLAFLLPAGALKTAAIAAAVSVAAGLLIALAREPFRRGSAERERHRSAVIAGPAAWIMQTFGRFVFLPYKAAVCLFAGIRAAWRSLVSHRKRLEWVPAADDERARADTLLSYAVLFWPAALMGLAILLLTPYPPAAAVGLLWIFSPLFAWSVSREKREAPAPTAAERAELMAYAADMRRYFAELMGEEEHFLPPDNRQTEPFVGTAHRTSPTNIGLALLASVAACDLGLITEETAAQEAEKLLGTVGQLSKWRGHLLNWYDTRTLSPLRPFCVSTVDSGNLAACLLAAEQAFRELGRAETAKKCAALRRSMDFSPLYDEKKRLFVIAWDMEEEGPAGGHYDLMASEARLTSYYAVSQGQVPVEHWAALSRALTSQDGYAGLCSWTGTAFEYLMPDLLLPCPDGSLLGESRAFCLYAQKKNAKKRPWGESESAFFAFDAASSYRYKAHGVRALAFKRGLEHEQVVAPYASFLALEADRRGALKNLRRLKSLGAYGPYGFYDAVDFTPERTEGESRVVGTSMAHHIGMSLIAVDNALNGGVMRRRFMADACASAYRELLEERIPLGAVRRRKLLADTPLPPKRGREEGYAAAGEPAEEGAPAAALLSNGLVSALLFDDGVNVLRWGDKLLTAEDGLAVALADGETVLPLMKKHAYGGVFGHRYAFTGAAAGFSAGRADTEAAVMLAPSDAMRGFTVTLRVKSATAKTVRACLYLSPALQEERRFKAHPAFSRLALEAKTGDGVVTVSRRGERAALCLMGKSGDRAVTSRLDAFGRARPFERAPSAPGKAPSASPEMIAMLVADVALKEGEWAEARFALAVGEDEEAAAAEAGRILREKPRGELSRLDGTARRLGLTTEETAEALWRLAAMERCFQRSEEKRLALERGEAGQRALWRFGVSGDLPILTARLRSDDDIEAARKLVREHALLRENGYRFDLVLLTTDGADYYRRQQTAIAEAADAPENVFTAEADGEGVSALIAGASLYLEPGETPELTRPPLPSREAAERRAGAPPAFTFTEDGAFDFTVSGRLPDLAWQHMLTNGRMGFLAAETGAGFLWYENARERRITPWTNDPLACAGPEDIRLVRRGFSASLFAREDGFACRVRYGFGYAVWEKDFGELKTRLTAFVPEAGDARVLLLETEGDARGAHLEYTLDLVLGPEKRTPLLLRADTHSVTAKNPSADEFPYEFRTVCSEPILSLAPDGPGREARLSLPCTTLTLLSGVGETAALSPAAARMALEETKKHWEGLTGALRVKTPSEALDHYINGWALYQTAAGRLLGRASLYQSGGAYGFRDQLQDATALFSAAPALSRAHILRAAARQYEEGDVQHWWHEPEGRGVRTRCSDDLLWLPYALCRYVEVTDDRELCRAEAPYLRSAPLSETERERYELAEKSERSDTLLRHAQNACELVLKRGAGAHGLCFLGTGDWNDGFSAVGEKGRGESVWLTWFFVCVLERMAALLRLMGDTAAASRYEQAAKRYRESAEKSWAGDRYLRGYDDDGAALGGALSEACRIDSIAQSFAVFAGADEKRAKAALKTAVRELCHDGVTALFTPPFDNPPKRPGYIADYAPGFRENGGQYTHAAVWLAMALFRTGDADEGFRILRTCLPGGRDEAVYKAEPYVAAADIYTHPDNKGRGGWTWYTGAAAWLCRAAVEEMLGLRIEAGKLMVSPRLPADWEGYEAEYLGHHIVVRGSTVTIDGKERRCLVYNKFIFHSGCSGV